MQRDIQGWLLGHRSGTASHSDDVAKVTDDLMDEDRVELLISAAAGAGLGIVAGYLLGHGWLNVVIWALIGAVVVSGAVHCYRAFSE